MTSRGLWLGLVLVAALCVSTVGLAEVKGEVNFFIGQKFLDLTVDDGLEDVEEQLEVGVALTFGDPEWPVLLALDVFTGSQDDSLVVGTDSFPSGGFQIDTTDTESLDIKTMEVHLGVRKNWREDKDWVFYVGGGVGVIYLKANDQIIMTGTATDLGTSEVIDLVGVADYRLSDDDSAIGFWASGGVLWRLTPKFSVGFDLRYSDAEVELTVPLDALDVFGTDGDVDIDAGGVHAGILAGYRW